MENPIYHILNGTCMTNLNTCNTIIHLVQILHRLIGRSFFSLYYDKFHFIGFFAFLRFSEWAWASIVVKALRY